MTTQTTKSSRSPVSLGAKDHNMQLENSQATLTEKTKTTPERAWQKFFREHGNYSIPLKNPENPHYVTAVSVDYLYKMFLDRSREE